MPASPSATSRYRFTRIFVDDRDPLREVNFFGSRDPVRFAQDTENEIYIVKDGDSLEKIASEFYPGYTDPAMVYWAIAEFQPEPILDPTLKLKVGRMLTLPSAARLNNLISVTTGAVSE